MTNGAAVAEGPFGIRHSAFENALCFIYRAKILRMTSSMGTS